MKAILVNEDKRLIWTDVPDPICGANEVKIEIAAASISDTLFGIGIVISQFTVTYSAYPPPPSNAHTC